MPAHIGRQILFFLLLLTYWLAVTLPHETFGRWINEQMSVVSKSTYNQIMLWAVVGTILFLAIVSAKKWLSHPNGKLLLWYFVLNAMLTAACMFFLFVINIEAIHFLQYAVFAILCYQLVPDYTSVLAWTILAGAADEAYQYLVLNPTGTDYYDLNDLLINTVGGLHGIWILALLQKPNYLMPLQRRWRSPLFILLYVISGFLLIGFAMGWVSLHSKEGAFFVFYKVQPEGFWSRFHHVYIYHIIRPWSYLFLTALIFILYRPLLQGTNISSSLPPHLPEEK